MGVGTQTLTPELAESFGAKGEKGILVSRVVPRSPAEKGGLRGGDIITSFRGKPVSGVKEFQKQVTAAVPGSAVAMDILREGKRARVEVNIAELEGQETPAQSRKTPVDAWGLAVEGLPARALRDLGIDGGVEVVYVDAAGPAWEGGIREGDVLLRINREPVATPEAYGKVLAGLPKGRMLSVLLWRDGAQIYVAFRAR
jgi:S1-C subfamily serine protease